jgi:hypothetical protein
MTKKLQRKHKDQREIIHAQEKQKFMFCKISKNKNSPLQQLQIQQNPENLANLVQTLAS